VLQRIIYPKIETHLNQIAQALNEFGFTPRQLTFVGLVLTLLTGCIYATGNFFLAGLFLFLASAANILKGPLAQMSGKTSKFESFLGSITECYSDFFLFGGIAVFYAKEAQGGWFLITIGILMGASVSGYAKARAETLMKNCSVGIFGKAERIMPIMLASWIAPLMPIVLWVLLIGTNITAIQHIPHVRKALRQD